MYAIIVSRKAVCIAFTLAVLNDPQMQTSDVQMCIRQPPVLKRYTPFGIRILETLKLPSDKSFA